MQRPVPISVTSTNLYGGVTGSQAIRGLTQGMILQALAEIEQGAQNGPAARMNASNTEVMNRILARHNLHVNVSRGNDEPASLSGAHASQVARALNYDNPHDPGLAALSNQILELKHYKNPSAAAQTNAPSTARPAQQASMTAPWRSETQTPPPPYPGTPLQAPPPRYASIRPQSQPAYQAYSPRPSQPYGSGNASKYNAPLPAPAPQYTPTDQAVYRFLDQFNR